MAENLRTRLSRTRALARTLTGKKGGFFIQYDYAESVKRVDCYPALERRCEAADLQPVLAQLDDKAVREDPFFRESTNHLDTLDALVAYAMIRRARPQRIIEIGSGRSTHVLCRAVADNAEGEITCIDPAPRMDIEDLPVTIERRVLEVGDVELVRSLQANDVLYIDSSHILLPGTDCDIEFNILLPELAPGVIVHVHDIFLPYAYPPDWDARNWNEACGLAPWILSDAFEVVFPTYWASREREEEMYAAMPDYARRGDYPGGSFWMRRR